MKLINGIIKFLQNLQGKPIVSIEDLKKQINAFETEKSLHEKPKEPIICQY